MPITALTLAESGICILEPDKSLIGGDEIDELRTGAREMLGRGNKKLILDMRKVEFINSSGVGALVSILTSYTNAGGTVKLCNAGKKIQGVLAITRLEKVFDIVHSREAAVASCK